MRDFILIGIVLLCTLLAVRSPVFGILTFVGFGFLNPHSMAWSIGQSFPFAQYIGLGTLVGYLFWSEPKKFPFQRETLLLSALWAMFGFSTIFAISDTAPGRLFHVSKILLMVFLTMSIINTPHRLHWLVRVIALSLGFYALKGGLFTITSGGSYLVFGPRGSFLSANNSIGMAMTMNIPLLVFLLKIETKPWLVWVIRGMLLFSYPAIIATYSRGAWIGLAVVTFLIVVKSRHKVLIVVALFAVVVTVLPLVPDQLVNRYQSLEHYEEDASAQSRFWNWTFCQRVGLARPWVGGGFDFYSLDAYATYFPEFLERWPGKVWACHSMWYTILGEHGFPGFILWLGLLGSCFLSIRRIHSYGKEVNLPWLVNGAEMLERVLVAYMIVGTFLDIAYFDMFYYMVAMVVIFKTYKQSELVTDSTPSGSPLVHEPSYSRVAG